MKLETGKLLLAATALVLFTVGARALAQPNPLGNMKNLHATEFTQEQYYEPPNDQQIKLRLAGAEALPLPGGLLDVKQLRAEIFSTNGVSQVLVLAPQCTYAPLDGRASSAGHLEIRSGNGQYRIEGEGFLLQQLQQTNLSLIISNQVRTVIELPAGQRKLL